MTSTLAVDPVLRAAARGATGAKRSMLDVAAPVAAIALGLGVPLLLVALYGADTGRLFLVATTVVAGSRLGWTAFRSGGSVVQPFFYLYFFLFLGVAPLVQLGVGRLPWSVSPGGQAFETAGVVVLAALLAHEAGILVGRLRGHPRHGAGQVQVHRMVDPRRVRLLVVVALFLYVVALSRLGGPAQLFSSRYERGQTLYGGRGAEAETLQILLSSATTAIVFVAAYAAILVAKRERRFSAWLVALVAVVLALTLTNPLSSARYHVGVVWGGLLIAALWPLDRRKVALIMTTFTAALVLLFPLLNRFRVDSAVTARNPLSSTLTTVDFDSYQMVATAVRYVQVAGHQMGEQLLGALTFWVPRSMWPAKPQGSGSLLGESFGFPITNLSTPLPAEAYLDGGFVLVVVVFVVYGYVAARIPAVDPRQVPGWPGIFVPVFAIYQVILLRGSLLQAMTLLALIAGAAWLVTSRRTGDIGPTRAAPRAREAVAR